MTQNNKPAKASATAIEYGLIAALVAVVIITAVAHTSVGPWLNAHLPHALQLSPPPADAQ